MISIDFLPEQAEGLSVQGPKNRKAIGYLFDYQSQKMMAAMIAKPMTTIIQNNLPSLVVSAPL